MKNIEVDYAVRRDGEVILDQCYATVAITDKNVKEVAAFILEGHGSGELVDVPGHVYDRIVTGVTETAIRDMKELNKDYLLESDEVILQEVLPIDLVNLLPQEAVDAIDLQKVKDYYEQYEEDCLEPEPTEETSSEEEAGLIYCEETNSFELVGEVEPNKENSLYLTIRQKYFDAIMEGTKTSEEREIKETTEKKLLDLDEESYPYFNKSLIAPDDPLNGNIYVWNDGKYPYYPNPNLRYLRLAVGYNKERDTALVELNGFRFKPMPTKNGIVPRFKDEDGKACLDPNGNLCFWCIEMLIKRVVECNRAKK